jgi:hypothetical protein
VATALLIYFSIGFMFVVVMLAKGMKKIKAIPAIRDSDENKKIVNNMVIAAISAYFVWFMIIIQFGLKEYNNIKHTKQANVKKVS